MRKSLLGFLTRYDTNVAVYTAIDEGPRLEIWKFGNGKNLLYIYGNEGADQQCSCSSVMSAFMFAYTRNRFSHDFLTIHNSWLQGVQHSPLSWLMFL